MKRQLKVRQHQRGRTLIAGYTRRLQAQTVLYTCERCRQMAFCAQLPGRKPKYCPTCKQLVNREQARHRKRRQRERESK